MTPRFLLAHGARQTLIDKPGAEYDSIDFTGIPSWVKRVTVMFNGVSLSGSSR